jgi:hypothetical protein
MAGVQAGLHKAFCALIDYLFVYVVISVVNRYVNV